MIFTYIYYITNAIPLSRGDSRYLICILEKLLECFLIHKQIQLIELYALHYAMSNRYQWVYVGWTLLVLSWRLLVIYWQVLYMNQRASGEEITNW